MGSDEVKSNEKWEQGVDKVRGCKYNGSLCNTNRERKAAHQKVLVNLRALR